MLILRCVNDGQVQSIPGDKLEVLNKPDAQFDFSNLQCGAGKGFIIERTDSGCKLVPLGDVLLNGRAIAVAATICTGDRISWGGISFILERDRRVTERTQQADFSERLRFGCEIVVPDQMALVLGREASRQVHRLNHPLVSRRHVEITRKGSSATVRDLSSFNGTFVSGEKVNGSRNLMIGDRLSLGPFCFVWTGDRLRPINRQIRSLGNQLQSQAELSCVKLNRQLGYNGDFLLRDISLSFSPGKFTCILGPSGSGKSTLVKALANREVADKRLIRSGSVLVNSFNLEENFEQLKHCISYVPQCEIVFDDLDVRTALYFTAKLRLPKDTTQSDIRERIDQVLAMVQLSDCRQKMVRKLSGGQRKRVALANELLAEPSILLVDEVTSGLDEIVDSEMMRLFRQIADSGKSVVCVTHTVANVPRDCHEIVALTRFGRLAFRGTPEACITHFALERLGDIYPFLSVQSPEEADRMAGEFHKAFDDKSNYSSDMFASGKNDDVPTLSRHSFRGWFHHRVFRKVDFRFSMHQFEVMFHRGILRATLDGKNNFLRLMQVLVVAVLLISVFGDLSEDPVGLRNCCFILVLSCFWFGCNNAAKEIVRERPIFEQERSVVLFPLSYAFSKLSVLSIFAIFQGIALMFLVQHWCQLPGELTAWFVISTATVFSGTALGLAISAGSLNQDVAVSAVPIVLIPQIILSGFVASLTGVNEWLAKIGVSSFWGVDATGALLNGVGVWQWKAGVLFPVVLIFCQSVSFFLVAVSCLFKKLN